MRDSLVPFLLPALAINVAIILIPGLLTIAMAFFEWDGASTPSFVGLDNFRTIFGDPVFFSALFNNIRWTVIFLTIPIAIGPRRRRIALSSETRTHVFPGCLFPSGDYRHGRRGAGLAR